VENKISQGQYAYLMYLKAAVKLGEMPTCTGITNPQTISCFCLCRNQETFLYIVQAALWPQIKKPATVAAGF
jgi:hypothetical protein